MNSTIRTILTTAGYCWLMLSILCLVPRIGVAEFYRYMNKEGRMVFVDDKSKIPPEYLEDLKTYKEKYDNLPDEQKAILIERERKVEDFLRERTTKEENARTEKKQLEKKQTNIVIDGNKVLVPVTLGYDGIEAQAMLVLDTGATIIALHRDVADRLDIKNAQKAKFRVVGGSTIETDVVQLRYVKVGPHMKKNLHAGIIDHEGMAVSYNGLLGMNFLRGLEYSIDFDNQVIKWHQ